jgi:hypothetical protein
VKTIPEYVIPSEARNLLFPCQRLTRFLVACGSSE